MSRSGSKSCAVFRSNGASLDRFSIPRRRPPSTPFGRGLPQNSMMKTLVEALCSDRCAGRAAGSPGGRLARELVVEAFADAGFQPELQSIPKVGGANVLARLPGRSDRWVIVAAHYDHVGTAGGAIYRGADDNAAAVAILIEVARALGRGPRRTRGVLFAAFDAEEPPNFLS